jgi:hypothetical protein
VAEPEPVPAEREARLEICERRLRQDWQAERDANTAYEAYRARGVMKDGRRFGRPPDPYTPPEAPAGKINTTDPDSKNMKSYRGYTQGYNAQAVTTEGQIIVAAEIAPDGIDVDLLDPVISAAEGELAAAGTEAGPAVVLADSGYWQNEHIDALRERGITPLVAADADKRKGPRKTRLGGAYDFMRRALASERGGRALLTETVDGRARREPDSLSIRRPPGPSTATAANARVEQFLPHAPIIAVRVASSPTAARGSPRRRSPRASRYASFRSRAISSTSRAGSRSTRPAFASTTNASAPSASERPYRPQPPSAPAPRASHEPSRVPAVDPRPRRRPRSSLTRRRQPRRNNEAARRASRERREATQSRAI